MPNISLRTIILAVMYIGAIAVYISIIIFLVRNVLPKLFTSLNIKILSGIMLGGIISLFLLSYGPYWAFNAILEGWKRAGPVMVEASTTILTDIEAIMSGAIPNYDVPDGGEESPFFPELTTGQLNTPDYIPTPVYTVPQNSNLHQSGGDTDLWSRPSNDGTTLDTSIDNNVGGGSPSTQITPKPIVVQPTPIPTEQSFDWDEWKVGDPIPTPPITPQP